MGQPTSEGVQVLLRPSLTDSGHLNLRYEKPLITEIPTPEEFAEAALNHLHLAWDIGITLVAELEPGLGTWDELNKEIAEEYWRLSQPVLANSLALIQQAQEFALKGKIASRSPFLLLSRDPREWPKRCDKRDTHHSRRFARLTPLI
jgi:hypothetical protein